MLLLAAQTLTRAGRDALSAFLVGASDVYAAIEGPHAWGTAHVARASTTTVEYAGITYLALKLDVEVAT